MSGHFATDAATSSSSSPPPPLPGATMLSSGLTVDETYEAVLEANGLTLALLAKKPQLGERIEIFMVNYRQMVCLDRFPQLRHLEIIQQELHTIEGLDACPLLETLFLPDNAIRHIGAGLRACARLRELNLNGNRLAALGDGVRHLRALEALFVCENRIESLAGVEQCGALRRLWAASNRITTVGSYALFSCRFFFTCLIFGIVLQIFLLLCFQIA